MAATCSPKQGLRELDLRTGAVTQTPSAGPCADAPLAIHGERVLLVRQGRPKHLLVAHLGRRGTGTIVHGVSDPVAGHVVDQARQRS
jgi:hypothetical protein